MKKDTNKLYDKIMESVAKEVKRSLNEDDVLTPKRTDLPSEAYVIVCTGLNKSTASAIVSI